MATEPPEKGVDPQSKVGEVEVAPVASQVFPLKFAKANDLATAINQLFAMPSAPVQRFGGGLAGGGGDRGVAGQGRGETTQAQEAKSKVAVVADEQSNALVASATEDALRKVGEIVGKLDISINRGAETRIFRLQHADAVALAPMVDELRAATPEQARAGAVGDARTNSLIVTAARETLSRISEMLGRLDSDATKRQRVFVRSATQADPDSVAKALRATLDDPIRKWQSGPAARSWHGDVITPLEESRLVIPPTDRVRD